MTQVIILNGGSSSGKTSIARSLQALLPDPWLSFSIDDFVEALPERMLSSDAGIQFAPGGAVSVGADFRTLEAAWMAGIAATARAGAHVVIDDVFLGGAASQQRWEQALGELDILWVGVRCNPEAAAQREGRRANRTAGMAAQQAETVHEGVRYDLELDTANTGSADCARTIAERLS
ncbi:Chloramphenicol phosphotransferase family protein [Catenulispora acidiphila DSM 44928]|uniref:Chloramphenicol phosphotransferase family protein n=1 Tax=Catenulispora acidiphila (strain DSM 44928 / JCM 14897 / NBRC 102108 / NRRL B-24433 / ID139908) TaxID=479433 RepID=C7QIG4_CATAD|nr:chloramphenicol phosphotransferase CPT [Catenulispora acidiphila]ACU75041.1 Chloramphenicol phosphotransferase family protein [Catenulispora acidiphila DSM 44928]